MNNHPIILVKSMRGSPRLVRLKKRFKKLGIKKYKIFYGIKGNTKKERDLVYSLYEKKKVRNILGRDMFFNEIASHYTTIRVYKYIVKNKIKNAICMDDDTYPSKLFKKWLDANFLFEGNKILGFFCAPQGFIKKSEKKPFLDDQIFLHKAKTHLFISQCIQVTSKYCQNFLKITNGKIIGQCDFPFNLKKNGTEVFLTQPYLVYPVDGGFSYLRDTRDNLKKNLIPIKIRREIIKYPLLIKCLTFLRVIYYLSFAPFFIKKANLNYYKEYFFDKYKVMFINFFTKRYIDINQQYIKRSNYPSDLRMFIKYFY
jgi:hypothetical protein